MMRFDALWRPIRRLVVVRNHVSKNRTLAHLAHFPAKFCFVRRVSGGRPEVTIVIRGWHLRPGESFWLVPDFPPVFFAVDGISVIHVDWTENRRGVYCEIGDNQTDVRSSHIVCFAG